MSANANLILGTMELCLTLELASSAALNAGHLSGDGSTCHGKSSFFDPSEDVGMRVTGFGEGTVRRTAEVLSKAFLLVGGQFWPRRGVEPVLHLHVPKLFQGVLTIRFLLMLLDLGSVVWLGDISRGED